MAGLVCWNCGTDLKDVDLPITRHSNCTACHEVLHCCRMCRHYAPSRPGECDHDEADPPVHKESANLCSYFKPRPRAFEDREGKRRQAAKSQLNALFGEDESTGQEEAGPVDSPSTEEDEIRAKLDDLFSDD